MRTFLRDKMSMTVILVFVLCMSGAASAGIITDTFEDGNYADGSPLTWVSEDSSVTWDIVTSSATGNKALHLQNNQSGGARIAATLMESFDGPVTVSLTYSRPFAGSGDSNVAWYLNLYDTNLTGYSLRGETHSAAYKYQLSRIENGSTAAGAFALATNGASDIADHAYRVSLTIDQGYLKLVHEDLTAGTSSVLIDANDDDMSVYSNFTILKIRQRRGPNEFRFEEVSVTPEPGTMSLLGVGSLLCWIRRRR